MVCGKIDNPNIFQGMHVFLLLNNTLIFEARYAVCIVA